MSSKIKYYLIIILNDLYTNVFVYLFFKIYYILIYLFNNLRLNYRQNIRNLSFYENKYQGKRCFIIGNGPSLKKTNLKLLKNEITFGLNRIYLNFKKMGYKTTFLVSVNKLLIEQCRQEINALRIPKFISEKSARYIKTGKNTMIIKSLLLPGFYPDIRHGIWEGTTVTYVAMQIAYYMGFKEIILIGVDHNFVTKGQPHSVVDQQTNDPNHFSPNYFKGMKWQLPDLKSSEFAYNLANKYFLKNGRRILDATVKGKLKIFGKIRLEILLKRNK